MPRQKIVPPEDAEADVQVRLRGRGRPKAEDDDPRLPMERGAIKDAGKARPMPTKEQASADIFTLYCRNLVANGGDPVVAIMATLGKTRDDVEKNLVDYHERIRAMSRSGASVSEMMEKHDLSREVRMSKLREALFSPTPAVALKAIEMLDEIDLSAKASRMGGTWESFVRLAKEKASKAKRA